MCLKYNMYLLYFCVLLLFPIYHFQTFNKGLSADEFGPYVLKFYQMDICAGRRPQNLTHITSNTTRRSDNKFVNQMNATFYTSIVLEETKVEVYKESKNQAGMILVYRYKIKNLCKHFGTAALLKRLYNTDSRCLVAKATYISEFNVSDMLTAYLGSNYFYGTFMFKVHVSSRKGIVFCAQVTMSLAKKT